MTSLLEFLQEDPECQDLASGALYAVSPLIGEPDPDWVKGVLDEWAFALAGRMPLPWSIHGALDALNHFLFEEQGLVGDRANFDDPQNALLNQVILRRRGLPITLSILWMEVAKRLGMDVVGIGLPGHFLTGLRLDVGTLYFDPFEGGRAVGEEDAARMVRKASGGRLPFSMELLDPMPHRAILARLVRNLHSRYVRMMDWNEALWTSTHLILLLPADPASYRERVLVRLRRGEVMLALEDLQEAIGLGMEEDPRLAEWIARLKQG